jgi:NAD(P)-dependent dehydrogenase (short-subunit alcohol dehydrogenase family)
MKYVSRRWVCLGLACLGVLLAKPPVAISATVLITGSDSGIGLEFAKQYAALGWTVFATDRHAVVPESLAKLAARYRNVRIEQLDVTSVEQADALAKKLARVPIDVLINNAGVYNDRSKCRPHDEYCPGDWSVERFGHLKFSLLDTIMAVNIKGPLIVSEALYANVLASRQKKIIAISSSNGSLTGPNSRSPGAIFYRASKAALNREMEIVATTVKKDGVTVLMFNPGPTLTERQEYLHGRPDMLTTAFTVGHMIHTIAQATIADTGRFLRYDGATEPW